MQNLLNVSYDYVLQGLLSMDTCKSSGPDEIPNIVLSEWSAKLCEPVTYLFKTSQKPGEFPDLWKTSYVSPIYK